MVLAVLITLGSTLALVLQEQKREHARMHSTLDQIGTTYTEALSAMVWDMGERDIPLLLDGIRNIPDVVHVAVYDEHQRLLVEKGLAPPQGVQRTYPLFQPEGLVSFSIGSLSVIMDPRKPAQRIQARALRIFAIRAVDLMVISLFFLWVIQILITRHLKTMAAYAQAMNLDRLETPLILHGRSRTPKSPDELDIVVDAMNTMRLSIRQGLHEKAAKARMEGEFQAAAAIQKALLPQKPPFIPLLDVAFSFEPALEVSGDYFDFFPLDAYRMAAVVADASGKGIPAALIANAARILIRAFPELLEKPEELLKTLNCTLPEAMGPRHFLTLGYLLVDTQARCLTLVSAGHDPFFLRKDSQSILRLKPQGYPFCHLHQKAFDMRLKSLRLSFEPGDCLLAYTDGLSESLSPTGERFGEERIQTILAQPHPSAQALVQHLIAEIKAFRSHTIPDDDTTLVILRFVP
jgi:sigma-B regulation protein RsbU (phosphoserine phosphatase)